MNKLDFEKLSTEKLLKRRKELRVKVQDVLEEWKVLRLVLTDRYKGLESTIEQLKKINEGEILSESDSNKLKIH